MKIIEERDILLDEKDELSRELEIAYEAIDKVKLKLQKERKERQALEEQLEVLEFSMSKQLKNAKQQAVFDFQETAMTSPATPQTVLAMNSQPTKKVEIFL